MKYFLNLESNGVYIICSTMRWVCDHDFIKRRNISPTISAYLPTFMVVMNYHESSFRSYIIYSSLSFILFVCLVLFWAQGLLGRYSTNWAMPPHSFFCFSYFSDKVSLFFPGPALDWDPLNYASCIAEFIVMHHHTKLICCDGVSLTFFLLGFDHDPPNLCLPSSRVIYIF
jgi:hypothetical protein